MSSSSNQITAFYLLIYFLSIIQLSEKHHFVQHLNNNQTSFLSLVITATASPLLSLYRSEELRMIFSCLFLPSLINSADLSLSTVSSYLRISSWTWDGSLQHTCSRESEIFPSVEIFFLPRQLLGWPESCNENRYKIFETYSTHGSDGVSWSSTVQYSTVQYIDPPPATQVAPEGPGSIMVYPRSHWNMICRPFWIFLT